MEIEINEVEETLYKILTKLDYSKDDINLIIDVYLGGELRGQETHGLAPFPSFVKQDFSQLEEPQVILHSHSLYYIDAKGHPGITVGRKAADEAIAIAKKEGVGSAVIKNMRDWSRPGAIANYIAKHNMVGVVTNIGSGQAVAPPGGVDPTLGTNPIAYAIPTENEPLEVEMATSKKAWGNVRIANKYGVELPEDTFLTADGSNAVYPKDAHSVKTFGEHKGFAISMMIAILNGTMLGNPLIIEADASNYSKPWPPNSGSITVYNPELFGGLNTFIAETQAEINSIKNSTPMSGQTITIPGESSGSRSLKNKAEGKIEIAPELWEEINSLLQV